MKKFVLFLFFISSCSAIEETKKEAIATLITLSKIDENLTKSLGLSSKGKEEVVKEGTRKQMEEMIQEVSFQEFDKNFTLEEINDLISFFESENYERLQATSTRIFYLLLASMLPDNAEKVLEFYNGPREYRPKELL